MSARNIAILLALGQLLAGVYKNQPSADGFNQNKYNYIIPRLP